MTLAITGVGWVSPVLGGWGALRAPVAPSPPPADAPWFDAEAELGRRGHKYQSAPTRYLLAAARRAFAQSGAGDRVPLERRGVIIGTSFADLPVRRRTQEVVRREGAMALSAVEAPNVSIGAPAGAVAIGSRCEGMNLTLTDPVVAGLQSLHWADRFLGTGQLDCAICGATEERADEAASALALGGACALVVERDGAAPARRVIARLSGHRSAFAGCPRGERAQWLRGLAAALARAVDGERRAGQVFVVSPCRETARDAREVLRARGLELAALPGPGDTLCAEPTLLPLFALLALIANEVRGTVVVPSPLGHVMSVVVQ